ncbi:MAG: hypothetical protein K6A68_06530 [Clostridiales bacterium]|nr:hypothetical protein [Clostridiales bacterium]
MTNRKRIGALMLCIGMALVLSVSAAFIIHEADHDCSGEDCPVCRMIAVNINLLRTLGLAVIAFLSLFFLISGRSVHNRRSRYACFFSGTPVSWKVRLND